MTCALKYLPLIVGTWLLGLLVGCGSGVQATNSEASVAMWSKYQILCSSPGSAAAGGSDGELATIDPNSVLRGIAVMGDSDSDEYRADDDRGGKYAATTFNWVEQLALNRQLNFGCWGTWPEPRRTGFEFNWARSGATAASLLTGGQHTGVAAQIVAGRVSLVFLHVGSNDFLRGRYEEIYSGKLSDGDLNRKVSNFVADITMAVDTVLDAGPVAVVIVDIQNPGESPIVADKFPQTAGRRRVAAAIDRVNTELKAMAEQRGAVLVSSATIVEDGLARITENGTLRVGDRSIDIINRGDAPRHLQLGDNAGHAGTVASGLLANAWFVEPVNAAFGTSIVPFGDVEILRTAGIKR